MGDSTAMLINNVREMTSGQEAQRHARRHAQCQLRGRRRLQCRPHLMAHIRKYFLGVVAAANSLSPTRLAVGSNPCAHGMIRLRGPAAG